MAKIVWDGQVKPGAGRVRIAAAPDEPVGADTDAIDTAAVAAAVSLARATAKLAALAGEAAEAGAAAVDAGAVAAAGDGPAWRESGAAGWGNRPAPDCDNEEDDGEGERDEDEPTRYARVRFGAPGRAPTRLCRGRPGRGDEGRRPLGRHQPRLFSPNRGIPCPPSPPLFRPPAL